MEYKLLQLNPQKNGENVTADGPGSHPNTWYNIQTSCFLVTMFSLPDFTHYVYQKRNSRSERDVIVHPNQPLNLHTKKFKVSEIR